MAVGNAGAVFGNSKDFTNSLNLISLVLVPSANSGSTGKKDTEDLRFL